MHQEYICRERYNLRSTEIVDISAKEKEKYYLIVDKFYENKPNVIKNIYLFSKTKNGELVWKMERVGWQDVWFPIDRLPIELEKMIRNE